MDNAVFGADVVVHIGILVHDIEETAEAYAAFLGVSKPEISITSPYQESRTTYLGTPTEARVRQTNFQIGPNLQIELLEPTQEPSAWRNDLNAHGEGFHHIALQVGDLERYIDAGIAKGCKLVQSGQWDTGRYVYLDAFETLKLAIEIMAPRKDLDKGLQPNAEA